MARIPDDRRPFDPARAMRERNQQIEAERVAAITPAPSRKVHRHGLRPIRIPGDKD